ncbi:hypothetical protein GC093_31180 [Paenibacillus sp. LMG 31456]|uniref:Lipoprotein n=1 Tax=Paenibacillus foliorum TaxID=2654974 RepID=A0A972K557_9BACL|nr:hypothetical protein [Paenibacillus foliorum]NOU97658.1 hypothetical protein [Paenibacillus foliorum]
MKLPKIMRFTAILATVLVVSACGDRQPETQVSEAKSQVSSSPTTVTKAALDTEKFNAFVKNIQGAVLIKSSVIANSNEAHIEFYESYDNFKTANIDSKLSKDDFNNFWATDDAINKVLMEEPIILLKEFPDLQNVSMSLSYQDKTYFVNADRSTVEDYLNVKLASMDHVVWTDKVVNKFFTKDERLKYSRKFIKIS